MEDNTQTPQPADDAGASMPPMPTPAPVSEPANPLEMPPAEQVAPPDMPPVESVLPPTSEVASNPEPVAAEPAPEVEASDKPAAPTAGSQKKVQLVEDDDNLASVYATRLEAEGFAISRAPNGESALSTALTFKPDLILLDVMMPKVSGFDVLDILRNTPETANIRVIMLTALGQESDQQRAKDLGVDDYLVKSQVVIADVVDRIKTHLNM